MVRLPVCVTQFSEWCRDIKPENFLLTSRDDAAELRTADFGLSCFFRPTEVFDSIVGSAYYVAPEVLTLPFRRFIVATR